MLGAMLLLGLASGVHCVGMCGGIVTAFSVVRFGKPFSFWPRQLAFNAGRISTYAALGAAAGALGTAAGALPAQHLLDKVLGVRHLVDVVLTSEDTTNTPARLGFSR